MYKFIQIFCFWICMIAVSPAALWVQTHEFGSGSFYYPGGFADPYTESWSFNKFDDQDKGWTLNSVRIEYYLYVWDGFVGQDNDGDTAANGTVGFQVVANLSATGVPLANASFANVWSTLTHQQTDTFNLAANDGDPADNEYNVGGDDWDSLSGADASNPYTLFADDYISPFAKDSYAGSGTFNMSLESEGKIQTILGGAVSALTNPQKADGFVRVTYDFVPEPMTMSLIGGSGLFLLLMNRFRQRTV